jgi:hypothetical protein
MTLCPCAVDTQHRTRALSRFDGLVAVFCRCASRLGLIDAAGACVRVG